jgi:hypothetical protein
MANYTDELNRCAAEFIHFYRDNPSYKEAIFKLKQAMFEIDLLTMSPCRREAMAAAQPNNTGQEPSLSSEAPLSPQP